MPSVDANLSHESGAMWSSTLSTPGNNTPKFDPSFAFGTASAAEVLTSFGLTFTSLKKSITQYERPALDVGTSYSTLICEAHFRGIPIFGTDLAYARKSATFFPTVAQNLERLKDSYTKGEAAMFAPENWDYYASAAIFAMQQQLSGCSASEITMPDCSRAKDQHFSTVLSHNAVPTYSTAKEFCEKQLPELLRVAAHQVLLHPFSFADYKVAPVPSGDPLANHIASIGAQHGFSFQLNLSGTAIFKKSTKS
jgi:hypothetical protein